MPDFTAGGECITRTSSDLKLCTIINKFIICMLNSIFHAQFSISCTIYLFMQNIFSMGPGQLSIQNKLLPIDAIEDRQVHVTMGCHFSIYSLLRDIHNSYMDIQKSFIDINHSFMDIQKSFMDILNSFMDI